VIARHERRIDRGCLQLPVVAALYVHIALHHADAGDAVLFVGGCIRLILRLLRLWLLDLRVALRRILGLRVLRRRVR
jgi:hypothetical protein